MSQRRHHDRHRPRWTTYSCIGVYQNGRMEIIAKDQGNQIMPSWVAFTDGGKRLIGEATKN